MKKKIVLDSFSLISLFHKEPGWEKVQDIFYKLSSSGKKALLNIVNWGEFYYIVKRRVGKAKTREALTLLEQLPIELVQVDHDLVKEAAEIKSEYPISYADAFCVATALRLDAVILTNDPEFKPLQHIVKIIWLTQ